jgi:hypothetical protein
LVIIVNSTFAISNNVCGDIMTPKHAVSYLATIRDLAHIQYFAARTKRIGKGLDLILTIDNAMFQIFGDGMRGFFINCGLRGARRGQRALERIGANNMARAISDAIDSLPSFADAKKESVAEEMIATLTPEQSMRLEELENRFTALPDGDVDQLLWRFITVNPHIFPSISLIRYRLRRAKAAKRRKSLEKKRKEKLTKSRHAEHLRHQLVQTQLDVKKSGNYLTRRGCRGDFSTASLWDIEDVLCDVRQHYGIQALGVCGDGIGKWMRTSEYRYVVAYVGDTIRRAWKGRWGIIHCKYTSDGVGIVSPNKRRCLVDGTVLEKVGEPGRGKLVEELFKYYGIDAGPDPKAAG